MQTAAGVHEGARARRADQLERVLGSAGGVDEVVREAAAKRMRAADGRRPIRGHDRKRAVLLVRLEDVQQQLDLTLVLAVEVVELTSPCGVVLGSPPQCGPRQQRNRAEILRGGVEHRTYRAFASLDKCR